MLQGFIVQGGRITEVAKAAGDSWHAIVGREIYEAKDVRVAAKEMTSQLFE
jgi:orotidine-5'-phosphate decarboxylase